ncbi:MAG: hypothetical protein JSW55_17490 [Chloroflexota bacterium]|nr:MAG: hypothetical protein JSW55_17490 [Chloroflexota bacterium]
MKATSIVDGIQRQSNGEVEVVHLNLLGRAGREIAGAYGVKVVPATVVMNRGGEVLYRRTGFPESARIRQTVGTS